MESQPIGDYFDEEMTFLKQIGVGYLECHGGLQVDPQLQSIEMGDPKNTAKTIHKIKESGLNVRVLAFNFVHSLMGRPEGAKEITRGCEVIKLMGEEDIPIMRIFPQGIRLGPSGVPGRHPKAHRGGSINAAFRLDYMRQELAKRDMESQWAHHYTEKITYDEYFANWVRLLERIIPIAEDAGVTIVEHFDDPPIPNYWNEGLTGWIMPRFYDCYTNQSKNILGETHAQAITDYIHIIGRVNSDSADRKTIEELILIGDPSLKIGGYP